MRHLMPISVVLCALGCARAPESPSPVAEQEAEPPQEVAEHAEHGTVEFPVSCNQAAQDHIEEGLAHLHHMMYEQSRPHFEAASEGDEACAMAHWGIAMTHFQPLWHPTSDEDLARGKAAVEAAQDLGAPTAREEGYIAAAAAFFADPDPPEADRPSDHRARVQAWTEAQRALHEAHPDDVDAAAFYGLAQVAGAPPLVEDETYSQQREAGALLEPYFEAHPRHPGLFHYLIHAYDNPVLAPEAEEVARGYDDLAPDVPHALHMPSHIFVRLGQWEETADWNRRSADAAARQPVDGVTSLHYPHALDYLMYAYLQRGEEAQARETLEEVEAIEEVQPVFASAYGIAAARARFAVEREQWEEAANLEPRTPAALPWEDFPAAEAIVHFARGLGAARSGNEEQAEDEIERLEGFAQALDDEGDDYWADQTRVQVKGARAWLAHERGDGEEALALMRDAADLEDSMEKHPITPGSVRPARELYGEMLLLEDQAEEALRAYEATLERNPNRRHAVEGAQRATEAAQQAMGG